MTQKTEAELALERRAKDLDARERELAAREAALHEADGAEVEPEDLTPYPTQAQNDAAKLGLREEEAEGKAGYATREARAK